MAFVSVTGSTGQPARVARFVCSLLSHGNNAVIVTPVDLIYGVFGLLPWH
jgi:hypothetical protein